MAITATRRESTSKERFDEDGQATTTVARRKSTSRKGFREDGQAIQQVARREPTSEKVEHLGVEEAVRHGRRTLLDWKMSRVRMMMMMITRKREDIELIEIDSL